MKTNHQEIWKDIKGYEGKYQVSSFGRVRSLGRTIFKRNKYGNISGFNFPGKIRKLSVWGNGGYLSIALDCKKVTFKNFLVHRLVAQAFIDNPLNLPEVNHIDANRINNHVENLEWCDRQGNSKHTYKIGNMPIGRQHHFAQLPRDITGRVFKRDGGNRDGATHMQKPHGQKLTEEQVLEIRQNFIEGTDTYVAFGKKYGVAYVTIAEIVKRKSWKHLLSA